MEFLPTVPTTLCHGFNLKRKLQSAWLETEAKLEKSCDQLDALNHQLEMMKGRLNRSSGNSCNHVNYALEMQIEVVEGVRAMYYEYSSRQAEKINSLWKMMQENNIPVPGESSERDSDMDSDMELDLQMSQV